MGFVGSGGNSPLCEVDWDAFDYRAIKLDQRGGASLVGIEEEEELERGIILAVKPCT